MTIGIYSLNFKDTDKVYIGQSINIELRYTQHLTSLIKKKSSKKLEEAYNLYGVPKLTILHICTKDELNVIEDTYIEKFDSVNNGFNTCISSMDMPKVPVGASSHRAKYSKRQYIEALMLLANTSSTCKEISKQLDMTETTIVKLSTGHSHKWLAEEFPIEHEKMLSKVGNKNKSGADSIRAHHSKDIYINIFKDIVQHKINSPKTNVPKDLIAKKYGVNKSLVSSIQYRQSHKWLKEEFPKEYELLGKKIS